KNRKLGKGKVGLDIGISTVAVSALTKVSLVNLAEQVKEISREITLTQRKMDRSKRTTNPQNFHVDGTIKKGKKYWVFSTRYKKLRAKLKEFHRKQAVIRTLSHRTLANRLLELGDTFYIETMNFKALQKRKKETEVSVKTGKYKRKKRFGKSLGHRAPAKRCCW
ncbi:RNA-guided endonuclease TnpB family protein, partial [Heyndrickxia sporothermodurans]